MHRTAIVLLLCLAAWHLRAQQPPILRYTTADGLPSDMVYSLYLDSRHWLWLATNKGLSRFNGQHFETFTSFDGLPGNEIFFLKEDLRGRLWIGSYNGALCYFRDGIFHTTANTPFLRLPFRTYHSRYISAEPDSSITIFFENQTQFINVGAHSLRTYSLAQLKAMTGNESVTYIRKPAPDRYQVFFSSRYALLDTSGAVLELRPYRHNRRYLLSMTGDKEYLYSSRCVYTLDEEPVATYDSITLDNHTINPFFFDGSQLAILGDNGISFGNAPALLPGSKITFVLRDPEGDYWIASANKGVFRMRDRQAGFHTYPGCYRGSLRYARTLNGTLYFISDDNMGHSFRQGRFHSWSCGHLAVPKTGSKGQWLLTDSLECFYNAQDGLFHASWKNRQSPLHRLPIPWPYSVKVLLFNGHSVFLQTSEELAELGPDAKLKEIRRSPTGLSRIFSSATDTQGRLWYATIDSMYCVEEGRPMAQPRYGGLAFLAFRFCGSYLAGYTHDNRLVVCNNIGNRVFCDTVHGQNCIWSSLYPLNGRQLLIGTSNYYRLLTFFPSEGLPRYTIQAIESPFLPRQAEYVCADDSNCYFFEGGNLTSVPLRQLSTQAAPPEVILTGIRTSSSFYPARQRLQLPYGESQNIGISFSGVSYASSELFYEYSISGEDGEQWHNTRNSTINLLAPGYGHFLIRVRARTLSSAYSKPVLLELVIDPPFWATWWFVLGAGMVIAGALWISVRLLLRRRQKKHEMEMRFQQSEFKALNALMNPHFIFNSLNNIQGLVNDDDKRNANQYLSVFSGLVRQNMHNISRDLISLQKELTLIDNYLKLEQLRFKGQLDYSITVDEGIDTEDILIPPLVVQPLVENAVRHGLWPRQATGGHVWLRVYGKGDAVFVEIRDNGVGLHHARRSGAQLHESFGLYNLDQRARRLHHLHNLELSLHLEETTGADGTATGTRALLQIRDGRRS